MATVNLGRIKPVFRGAYNNSTAYVIDDIVTSGNETFIAIAATQGNATTDASKWTKLAAKGSDGTDVAATLQNKEIAFKTNAGALDGIPIGSAGEFLKVNSGATGYEYGAVSSDFVKLATTTVSSGVGYIDVDNVFNQSGYNSFQIDIKQVQPATADALYFRFLNNSDGSEYSTGNYRWAVTGQEASSGGQNDGQQGYDWNSTNVKISGHGGTLNTDADARGTYLCKMFIYSPHDSFRTGFHWLNSYLRNGNDNHMNMRGSGHVNVNNQFRGFRLVMGSGNINKAVITTYGIKE